MANTSAAKKSVKQNAVRRQRNLHRRTAVKTAIKKVLLALDAQAPVEETQQLLRVASSQLARAQGKGVMHAKAASRKLSRLAKRVSAAQREQK